MYTLSSCLLAVLLAASSPSALGEIKVFNSNLVATSTAIQYSSGYLVDPGYIDLTDVRFAVSKDNPAVNKQDRYTNDDDTEETLFTDDDMSDKTGPKDDKAGTEGDDVTDNFDDYDYNDGSGGDGGSNRVLALEDSVIDVIFFHEPANCTKTQDGCDWTKLGIGGADAIGNTHWCCSEDTAALGICDESSIGRLIIDNELFGGEQRPLVVPSTGDFEGSIDIAPKMDSKQGTGKYTLVLANCDDYGRDVHMHGKYLWKSKDGYLPGNLFSELYFFVLMTLFYGAFLCSYAFSMKKNEDATIGIQRWILCTIVLSVIELFLKTSDYMEWNVNGFRMDFIMYLWILVDVLKGAISRCLLVMVSLGWGVIRDTLGEQMRKIVVLGIIYSALALGRNVAEVVFVEELQVLSIEEEEQIYDIFSILTVATSIVDVTFYMWILDGLNSTMQYLENMNQHMKLKRYLRLRLILLLSILFAIVWSIFGIVDATKEGNLLNQGDEWLIRGLWEMNYTFVLVTIAWLWKPDPRAKEFAYVMELPSVGDDMVLDSNMDEDEDGVDVSYSDLQQEGKFNIDKGVST